MKKSLSLTVVIPYLNQLNDTKGPMGCLRHNTSETTEWLIIDNGSTEKIEQFFLRYLRPKRMNFIRNEENIGMLKTMQQGYENADTDIIAFLHNDVFIFERDWDKRILSYFEQQLDLGGIGLFGAQGCGLIGERIQDVPSPDVMAGMSNMLEAEIHGMRMAEPWRNVAIFDGFAMIFRKEALKKSNGFDQRYHYHHLYDRDASLEVLKNGYRNIVVDIPCHHLSGLTANRTDYQEWINKKTNRPDGDKWTHDDNSVIFKNKWADMLPLYVENDGSFRANSSGQWQFKGDKIKSGLDKS